MNEVILIGRLTADPELKQTDSGKLICRFSLAVRRNENDTDFIPCVAFDGTAGFLSSWFTKGKSAAVRGSIRADKYTDNDGHNKTAYSVVCKDIHFCS